MPLNTLERINPMNILFYRYGCICEPDILEVFRNLQLQVYENTLEMTEKNLTSSQKLSALIPILCEQQFDFVFSLNYFPYLSQVCERLHILYVCWSVDCPVLELFSETIHNSCNRIFLFDYAQYLTFAPQNPDHIYYLPLATNVNRWDAVLETLTEEDRRQFSCDISFVGSLYHEKSPLSPLNSGNHLPEYWKGYINGLTEAQLKIYGSNFLEEALSQECIDCLQQYFPDFYHAENTFAPTDRYVAAHYYLGMHVSETERIRVLNALSRQHHVTLYTRSNTSLLQGVDCRGGVTTHIEMPKIFHLSKINLNITIKPIQTGLSLRIWDVLGCGGFLLSNYQQEIPEYFEIGKDLDCYESMEDLKQKTAYYLSHDDIRQEIALNGYEKVRTLHTYEMRILTIIKQICM